MNPFIRDFLVAFVFSVFFGIVASSRLVSPKLEDFPRNRRVEIGAMARRVKLLVVLLSVVVAVIPLAIRAIPVKFFAFLAAIIHIVTILAIDGFFFYISSHNYPYIVLDEEGREISDKKKFLYMNNEKLTAWYLVVLFMSFGVILNGCYIFNEMQITLIEVISILICFAINMVRQKTRMSSVEITKNNIKQMIKEFVPGIIMIVAFVVIVIIMFGITK